MGLSYLIPTKFHGDPFKFMSEKKTLINMPQTCPDTMVKTIGMGISVRSV